MEEFSWRAQVLQWVRGDQEVYLADRDIMEVMPHVEEFHVEQDKQMLYGRTLRGRPTLRGWQYSGRG